MQPITPNTDFPDLSALSGSLPTPMASPVSQTEPDSSAAADITLEIDDQGVKTISGPAVESPAVPAPTASSIPVEAIPMTNIGEIAQPVPVPVEPLVPPISQTAAEPTVLPAFNQAPANTIAPQLESAVLPPLEAQPTANANPAAAEAKVGMKDFVGILPADTNIETFMLLALERKASDIHFAAGYPVMIRVDGALIDVSESITGEHAKILALSVLNADQKKLYEDNLEIDLSYTSVQAKVRFRINLFTDKGNCAGALRLIATKIKTIKDLDLPDILFQILEEPYGLVLVVGPTGSGKSTTLAAMLNHININKKEHIVTVEDPVEYIYPVGQSIVNQRELSADTKSWKNALKSALREDPNVVLVGEMRDLETTESTITIAETGHLTFATLHTNSASQAIDRIIDIFPDGAKAQIRAQLANVLVAVISQRLIPIAQGGRKAVLEVMLGTVAVRNAIREGKTYQIDNIMQTSGDLGMLTLEKSLAEMVKTGLITKSQAFEYTAKPDELENMLSHHTA